MRKEKDIYPTHFELGDNYPNPFNPSTSIDFTVPKEMFISIIIYDVNGRHIKTMINGILGGGHNSVIWDGSDRNGKRVSSGVYFYELRSENNTIAKKMILLK